MKVLVYMQLKDLAALDELMDPGLDSGAVDEYIALTVDGAPLVYTEAEKPGADHFNNMALQCMGVTE